MSVANNPLAYARIAEVVACECRIYRARTKPYSEATGSTKPAIFWLANQSSSLNVTASAANNISGAYAIPFQALGILDCDLRNSIRYNSVVPYVLGHDGRDSLRYVIPSMKLAPEGACLDAAPAKFTGFSKCGVDPLGREGAYQLFNCHTRVPSNWR